MRNFIEGVKPERAHRTENHWCFACGRTQKCSCEDRKVECLSCGKQMEDNRDRR